MDYNRFSGNNTNSYYKGWGYGSSLTLFPKTKQGIFITASYDYFTFEKIISDLNELPLNQLTENIGSNGETGNGVSNSKGSYYRKKGLRTYSEMQPVISILKSEKPNNSPSKTIM